MKKQSVAYILYILFMIVSPLSIMGQQEYGMGISGFYVHEKNNLDIDFTTLDLRNQLVYSRNYEVNYGLRFIGATTGNRGGYFAFGYFTELVLRPDMRFQPGLNVALLAGGGAEAPDYDGWMAQGVLFARYKFYSGTSLSAGLNYARVSGGEIAGFSPWLGLNWQLENMSYKRYVRTRLPNNALYGDFGIGRFKNEELILVGAGARLAYGKYFSGDFMFHTIANTFGGYMQMLISGGPDLAIGNIHLSPALIFGLGGGGAAQTKGGGLYGGQLGLNYVGENLFAGIKYQYVDAFSNAFGYQGLFVSLGKTLHVTRGYALSWDMITKAYIGKEGFGNIGARFTAFEYGRFRMAGTTYWALTHGRGAYAEGLFELLLTASERFPLYLVTSVGAGAGAGINRKTASFIYGGGIGYAIPSYKFPFSLECAYWDGGNMPQWSLGLSFRISELQ